MKTTRKRLAKDLIVGDFLYAPSMVNELDYNLYSKFVITDIKEHEDALLINVEGILTSTWKGCIMFLKESTYSADFNIELIEALRDGKRKHRSQITRLEEAIRLRDSIIKRIDQEVIKLEYEQRTTT